MKKRILSMILVGVLALLLSACGESPEEKKDSNDTAQSEPREESAEDEMSQAEWMEEYGNEKMQDGYEVVDEINIDTKEISLKYTGHEIIDSTDDDGNPIKQLIVYCDFTNKTNTATSSSYAISSQAFQNGIELQAWGGSEYNEPLKNEMVDIMDGATLNVGYLFDLRDTENPVKIRISSAFVFEEWEMFAQQQEIILQ